MKQRKLQDRVIVAALLLACIPGLAEDMLPAPAPIALIEPAAPADTPGSPFPEDCPCPSRRTV